MYFKKMLTQIEKVIISIVLSLTSIGLFVTLKGKERKISMIAMLLSTIADIFMTDILSLGEISTYPGAAFFILAHLVYAFGFFKASKRKGYTIINKGAITGIILVVLSAVALGIIAFSIEEPQTVMFFLILVYYLIIGFNLVMQFSYATNEKGSRLMLIPAMTLFLISDFTIFLNMLAVTPEHNDLVWLTYIPAQFFIILFNSNLRKEK